jgi:hypothetical protein
VTENVFFLNFSDSCSFVSFSAFENVSEHIFRKARQLRFNESYSNITNIVVRISCGEKCNNNAVMMNAHYDSLMGSQGASDDAVGVSVLLEIIRVLSQNPRPMHNAAIFCSLAHF